MNRKSVAIVGGGVAGIVSAKYALENGLLPTVFEKSKSIGGLWSLDSTYIWEGMTSTASIYTEMFSDHPWPNNSYVFPSAMEINKYLKSYIKRFSLLEHFLLNQKVENIEKHSSNTWNIISVNLETLVKQNDTFDFLIIATGENAVPRMPIIENYDNFKGIQIHSSEFKLNDKRFKDKNIAVVNKFICNILNI